MPGKGRGEKPLSNYYMRLLVYVTWKEKKPKNLNRLNKNDQAIVH